jgi:Zn-dependent protease
VFGADLGPLGIALVIAFLVISLGIHEAAHGWVALKCGDPTARDLGRITLNPIPHIDPIMTILVPLLMVTFTGFIFGGAKPVPVSYHRLRHPLRDMMLVALAGPASNFVLAILFMLGWKASRTFGGYDDGALMPTVLYTSVWVNVLLAVFNLFPIPPLDGSRVMAWLLPDSLRPSYIALERFGLILVLGVFWLPAFRNLLFGGINTMLSFINQLTGGSWA